MDTKRSLGFAMMLAVALAPGCSKKSSSTQPPAVLVESFNSGVFTSGVFVHTFSTVGTFGYQCSVHGSSMSGGVEVGASHPESAFVNINDNFFSPSLAKIRPGAYVKWIANGSNHGVRNN